MPFKSQSQRAYFYSQLPNLAKKWEEHTPEGKLPKHVKKNQGGIIKSALQEYLDKHKKI